jgi:hypothetical protein
MKCKNCGEDYTKAGITHPDVCASCSDDFDAIDAFVAKGHSHHCACRQVWGDGECEYDLYAKGYDPYAWMKDHSHE